MTAKNKAVDSVFQLRRLLEVIEGLDRNEDFLMREIVSADSALAAREGMTGFYDELRIESYERTTRLIHAKERIIHLMGRLSTFIAAAERTDN